MWAGRVKFFALLALLPPLVTARGEYLPRTVVTPILHSGDPAPGIPGATVAILNAPQIDGAGDVLIRGWFVFDGETVAHGALWYGGAEGLVPAAYYGMQAPDMPAGVTYRWVFGHLAECGWIGISAYVQGPGIVPGFNDLLNFAGPPGDIRKVMQAGEPAPGLEPGTIIDASRFSGLTAYLSDNAAMMVVAWLAGPGIDESNDKVIWIGPRDDLQLIWRSGMEAPGTDGARFAWANFAVFNDQRQIAFIGGLVHEPGIDYTNHVGIWAGSARGLRLIGRYGHPAPGTSDHFSGISGVSINKHGDVVFGGTLDPPGGPIEYEHGLWLHTDNQTVLLARDGDIMREIGPDVHLVSVGSPYVAGDRSIFYRTKYEGRGIDSSNAWAMWFGPGQHAQQELRDDSPAPSFPTDIRLRLVGIAPGVCALNEHGDIVTGSEITGSGVGEQDNVILWLRDSLRQIWFPLLRSGTAIDERTLVIRGAADLSDSYCNKTGGSDGMRQSFNDAGQLAIRMEFTDGTHGVYVAELNWAGDSDGDRDLDVVDFAALQWCFGGAVYEGDSECHVFDFDENGLVDVFDYGDFLEQATGPWSTREGVVQMGE